MEKANESKFQELFEVHENNFCFECGTDDKVIQLTSLGGNSNHWASVNNGILLCPACASIHKGFGPTISLVKSLTQDKWTTKEIEMMKKGGNDKLQECFEKYNVPLKGPLEFKYKTKAAQHHREKLKALVEKRNLPVPPSLEEGSKSMVTKTTKLLRARRTVRNPSTESDRSKSREPKSEDTPKKPTKLQEMFKNAFKNKSGEKQKESKKKKEAEIQQENKENVSQNQENINANLKENAKESPSAKSGLKSKGLLSGGIEAVGLAFKRLTIRKKKDFISEICNNNGGEEYSFTFPEGSASGDYLDL